GMIICSTSKPTIAAGSSPPRTRGTFISSGGSPTTATRRLTCQSVAMPPRCATASRRKPSTTSPTSSEAGATTLASASTAEPLRQRRRQLRGTHLGRRGLVVVGHAKERQHAIVAVEHRVARGGIAVARLPGRAGDREPTPVRRERDRDAGRRSEVAGLSGAAQVVEHRHVDVAAEGEAAVGREEAPHRLAAADEVRPLARRPRIGVDEERVAEGLREWQLGEKGELVAVEAAPRPFDDGA